MERHQVTVDRLLTELEEAWLNAKEAKQPSSEVSAIMGKAKLAGLLVEKRQEVKEISEMSAEELAQSVRDRLGDKADLVIEAFGLETQPPRPAPSSQAEASSTSGEKPVGASGAPRKIRLAG